MSYANERDRWVGAIMGQPQVRAAWYRLRNAGKTFGDKPNPDDLALWLADLIDQHGTQPPAGRSPA